VDAGATYTAALSPASATLALRVYKIGVAGRLSFIGDGPTIARHTTAGGSYVGRVTATTANTGTTASYAVTVRSTP